MARVGTSDLAEWKRRFLDASMADGKGGAHGTGPRWWFVYRVFGQGKSPLPDPRCCSYDDLLGEEIDLEDYAVWLAVCKPSGKQISHISVLKYVSGTRSFYRRYARRELGLGAKSSIIPDLLKGYARLVDQRPPMERLGCTPADLAAGLAALGASPAWISCLSFAMVALARGCEVALDAARGEQFEPTEHMTACDVDFFMRGGVRNARVRMRKRKDLRVLRGKQSVVIIAGGSGGHFDAADALFRWIQRRRELGIADDTPLFCYDDGLPFTVSLVRDMVKAVMQAAGRDPSLYGAHSLRIGGATAALAAGVPPALIRLMGRWSSDVYEIYCRMSEQSALGVGTAIASAMVTDVEAGFHEEHLELQASEIGAMRAHAQSTGAGDIDADDDTEATGRLD